MSNYRRALIPGGVFFFTVVTYRRRQVFTNDEKVDALRRAFRRVRAIRPFEIDAIVILPDHLHCIWRLPEGDGDFSGRWREIKKAASRAIGPHSDAENERKVWQRRFWEHAIRDEADWRRHMDYIHYNPVRHQLVSRPWDWPWSSFARCVERGWYDASWGCVEPAGIRGLDFE
ncbi:MAG: transposase [Desulfobacterales bacterium]|nr:transposase [Desulfobacterales bacterium]